MSNIGAVDTRPLAPSEGSCCPPLTARALTTEAAGQLAPMFKALGDPVRLRLLSLIASTDEVCVCDLTDAFTLSGPTISHHLRVLRETGLVAVERRATWAYYRIRPEVMAQLSALLAVNAAAPAAA